MIEGDSNSAGEAGMWNERGVSTDSKRESATAAAAAEATADTLAGPPPAPLPPAVLTDARDCGLEFACADAAASDAFAANRLAILRASSTLNDARNELMRSEGVEGRGGEGEGEGEGALEDGRRGESNVLRNREAAGEGAKLRSGLPGITSAAGSPPPPLLLVLLAPW